MQIVRGLESFPPDAGPSAVALGAFDGIHLGHRAILGTAVTLAQRGGLSALACTFDRHPMEVLQPDRAPLPITTLEERLELIAETGIDTTVVIPFTPAIAAIEAKAFVQDVLIGRLKAGEIVVGFNHRFGRGARGDVGLLETLAGPLGFRAHVVQALMVDGVAVSAANLHAIPGSDFAYVQLHVDVGSHVLEADAPFGAFVYGWDVFDSYGYPGGPDAAEPSAFRPPTSRRIGPSGFRSASTSAG